MLVILLEHGHPVVAFLLLKYGHPKSLSFLKLLVSVTILFMRILPDSLVSYLRYVMSIYQEDLYELILQTNKESLKLCKPGASIQQIHNYSVLGEWIFFFFGFPEFSRFLESRE